MLKLGEKTKGVVMTNGDVGQAQRPPTVKEIIITKLKSTERNNIDNLIGWLEQEGFFESPASTKYHGCYVGGLAKHSLNVYDLLDRYVITLHLDVPNDSIIIAALLHDVCKIGAYIGQEKPYSFNRMQPKGHALLSLERIKKFIKLTELEEKMVLYHMGIYGLVEFQDSGKEYKGEYTLRNNGMANAWYHHPVVKIMYFCDEIATLEEKAKEE